MLISADSAEPIGVANMGNAAMAAISKKSEESSGDFIMRFWCYVLSSVSRERVREVRRGRYV
jgi:hypothetical protein